MKTNEDEKYFTDGKYFFAHIVDKKSTICKNFNIFVA
jgi:hypothetical protein